MQKSSERRSQLRAPVSFIEKVRAGAAERKMTLTKFMEEADVVYLESEVTTE